MGKIPSLSAVSLGALFFWNQLRQLFLEPIKTAKSEMPVLNEYKSNTLPLEQPCSAVTRRLFIRKARDRKVSELAKILC